MDRRSFLTLVAGSPFVFGLRELLGQETAPKSEWIKAALKRMKETRRYGVVLVIPPGQKGQVRLGETLLARLSRPEVEDNEIFCEVVFLFVTEEQAKDIWKAPLDGDKSILDGVSRILVDPNGNRVAGDRIDLDILEMRVHFRKSFDEFVHGEDGKRLESHRLEIEKTLSPEILRAGRRLTEPLSHPGPETDEERGERRAAMDLLRDNADTVAPWLALKGKRGRGESPFRVVLWEYFLTQSELEPEPLLPYGIRAERFRRKPGCSGENGGPLCEMARIRLTDYRFLQFLAK